MLTILSKNNLCSKDTRKSFWRTTSKPKGFNNRKKTKPRKLLLVPTQPRSREKNHPSSKTKMKKLSKEKSKLRQNRFKNTHLGLKIFGQNTKKSRSIASWIWDS